MAPRSGVRPSLPFVYSLFAYVIRTRKIIAALLTAVLLSNPVAAATLGTAPIAAARGQDLRYEFYSSGWAKSLGIHLTSTTQGSGTGLDRRGAPRRDRPAPARAETKADREMKVARIKIYPGDVEIATGERVIFTAVGLDSDGNAIGGLDLNWEGLHEDKGRRITVRQGSFSSPIAGKFIITAEAAGRREQVRVTVKRKSALPQINSKSEIKIDSRQLRRSRQVSMLAPSQGNAKRLIAGKNTAGKNTAGRTLRASSKSMARVPRMFMQLAPGEDPTGWNSQTVATFSNVGAERGDMPGRAPSAGVGSGNFQITAPGVSLDGRDIDINLPLHYNSRVWHNSGGGMYFDIDRNTLVAGWNIGFGKIVTTGNQYMLIDADGARHEFSGSTSLNWPFQAFQGRTTDGTFIDYSANGYEPGYWQQSAGQHILTGSAVLPNGTKIVYGASGNYAVYPTRITDAHGNYITITYRNNKGPNIDTITDTLGRVIRFHYDGGNLLTAITVPGLNGGPERQVVRLAYRWLTLSDAGANYGFSVPTWVRQNTIPVLQGIYYPATGSGYWSGFVGPMKSTKVVGESWGVKVKIIDALNVPKSTVDFVEVYSFGLTNSCRLVGATRNELMKFYPIGSKVRVVGSESTIIGSVSKAGTIRLEVTEYNYGLIARNDLNEGFDISAQSYYDYERDELQTRASKASIYYYYSTIGDFELWKDLIRLHRMENESERFEILKRLSKYHLKGYKVDYNQLVKNYLNNRAMIDKLLRTP